MALLTPSVKAEKVQIRINIDVETIDKAKVYCAFAGIKKIDEFFEKAAEFVLAKDKGWRNDKLQSREPEQESGAL